MSCCSWTKFHNTETYSTLGYDKTNRSRRMFVNNWWKELFFFTRKMRTSDGKCTSKIVLFSVSSNFRLFSFVYFVLWIVWVTEERMVRMCNNGTFKYSSSAEEWCNDLTITYGRSFNGWWEKKYQLNTIKLIVFWRTRWIIDCIIGSLEHNSLMVVWREFYFYFRDRWIIY